MNHTFVLYSAGLPNLRIRPTGKTAEVKVISKNATVSTGLIFYFRSNIYVCKSLSNSSKLSNEKFCRITYFLIIKQLQTNIPLNIIVSVSKLVCFTCSSSSMSDFPTSIQKYPRPFVVNNVTLITYYSVSSLNKMVRFWLAIVLSNM